MKNFKELQKNIAIVDHCTIYAKGLLSILYNSGFYNVSIFDNRNTPLKLDGINADIDLLIYHVPSEHKFQEISESIDNLKKIFPKAEIIIYSIDFTEDILASVVSNNLNGYFLVSEDNETIVHIIKRAGKGEVALSEKVEKDFWLHKRVNRFKNATKQNSEVWNLTPREIKTLNLLAQDTPLPLIRDEIKIKKGQWSFFLKGLYNKIEIHL